MAKEESKELIFADQSFDHGYVKGTRRLIPKYLPRSPLSLTLTVDIAFSPTLAPQPPKEMDIDHRSPASDTKGRCNIILSRVKSIPY